LALSASSSPLACSREGGKEREEEVDGMKWREGGEVGNQKYL